MGFVARDRYGQAADFFGILDFDVAVAEGEQLFAADLILAQDPFEFVRPALGRGWASWR